MRKKEGEREKEEEKSTKLNGQLGPHLRKYIEKEISGYGSLTAFISLVSYF